MPIKNLPKALCYQLFYETPEEDEPETISELKKLFVEMSKKVADKEGHAYRAVHAKGQGLLRGRLTVLKSLPKLFAQGIFASLVDYEAVVRLSSPPAEQLSDNVSTPRALALKVLGVNGEHVPESEEVSTQDFLMVNGATFVQPGPKGFLRSSRLLALTTEKMPKTKEVISAILRGTEKMIEAVGGESATIKNMGGQAKTHPLGETYFSQSPFMYGPYMAKFSLAPTSAMLKAIEGRLLDSNGDNARRESTINFFADPDVIAEWELRVQLCTDIKKMPIEDASVEWDQDLSPYITVAKLTMPSQIVWKEGEFNKMEDHLAFDPWHAIVAHRPLGALNRARKEVMKASRDFRSGFNKCPIHEPTSEHLDA